MKIFANASGAIKALSVLKYLKEYRRGIKQANAAGDTELEREYILKSTSTWGKKMVQAFGAEIHVEGRENLPEEGPVVYVCNHQGYGDIIALCATLDTIQFGFVAKQELAKIPVYGPWILEIRSVLIERDHPRESIKAISKGINYINDGFSMLIFPEGTRSKGGEMAEFKKGALKLATKPKVPIVPISINDSWRCFEEEGKMKGAKVGMIIHPAIETKDLTKEEEKFISDRVEDIVREGVKKLQEESVYNQSAGQNAGSGTEQNAVTSDMDK